MAKCDQAEGLRRMLDVPKLRVLTFLSALSEPEKSGMIINLSATLARQGQRTLMVDAQSSDTSIGAWMSVKADQTLLNVARQQRSMENVIKEITVGLSVTMVTNAKATSVNLPQNSLRELSKAFDLAASRSDVVMVDSVLDANDSFLLASLDDSEIIIQVSADPHTIKKAYGMIKRLNERLGRRSYGLIVSGETEAQANVVYTNLARTADRYLAVPLKLIGSIPSDSYLDKATQVGRSVIDAFPLSKAAIAFTRIAEGLVNVAQSNLNLTTLPRLDAQLEL
jgi:flagellar biosynthesis protein FlhG